MILGHSEDDFEHALKDDLKTHSQVFKSFFPSLSKRQKFYLLIIAFVFQMDGYVSLITVRYCRFKSRPVNELLVLPTITPSGLSIGTSLKINL